MGMHFGLIAARVSVADFLTAFSKAWPELEITASADEFSSTDELWEWKDANERFVSAADAAQEGPGSEVYILCQDGPWALFLDFSYVLAGDEKALKALSEELGQVLSFVVQTTSGCAFFWNYESGELRRMIQSVDGEVEQMGSGIAEEEGIDIGSYYMDETEELMHAFGISLPDSLPIASTAVAISTVDHTDYSELLGGTEESDVAGGDAYETTKPWWKFW